MPQTPTWIARYCCGVEDRAPLDPPPHGVASLIRPCILQPRTLRCHQHVNNIAFNPPADRTRPEGPQLPQPQCGPTHYTRSPCSVHRKLSVCVEPILQHTIHSVHVDSYAAPCAVPAHGYSRTAAAKINQPPSLTHYCQMNEESVYFSSAQVQ